MGVYPSVNGRLREAMENRPGNYILPFFWQHGESAALLREGMEKIRESGIGAVCVESRPHPDFLGEKWWRDMDVVMAEAKRLEMRVWVLDDAHFPSGACNGRITDDSPYGKDYLTHVSSDAAGPLKGHAFMVRLAPGERLLAVVMGRRDKAAPDALTDVRDLTDRVCAGKVYADIPEGIWSVTVLKTTRRGTGRKNYINTLDRAAVRFFIDTVYEPHYARYGADFGSTFAGFFSDEPEIGNGSAEHGHHLRAGQSDINLPWSRELEEELKSAWGSAFAPRLASLFADIRDMPPGYTAANRLLFTDRVARLYGKNFCGQIGAWCRERGAEYIGHVIEDDGRHAELGLGTAHYFRALWGQDMAGIDVVLQQLRPEMDDFPFRTVGGVNTYNGEFFHYGLALLGTSLARIDPKKKGRTVCEVFGAYGWAEGLRGMKWILDHMMASGVNHFVPHAFTMKDFPDPDCPPHFYARGNNPQYPYFRYLMEYALRVCHLISGGRARYGAAVLYTAEQEWAGDTVQFEKAAKELIRAQIPPVVLPADFLAEAEMEDGRLYLDKSGDRADPAASVSALVVPSSAHLPLPAALAVERAARAGVHVVVFGGSVPDILDEEGGRRCFPEGLLERAGEGELAQALRRGGIFEITSPVGAEKLRFLSYVRGEAEYRLFFNGSSRERVDAQAAFSADMTGAFWYDPWTNELSPCGGGHTVALRLAPSEMRILILPRGQAAAGLPPSRMRARGRQALLPGDIWRISLKEAGEGKFVPIGETKLCDLSHPDRFPYFSGTVRYETRFDLPAEAEGDILLDLGEAHETAEVFLNGISAGVRVSPPYRFHIGSLIRPGENRLEILIVNTLVHRLRDELSMTLPMDPSGLLGPVRLLF